ncbi:hypothetical protein [Vibrio pectenicida]|uniref:Uncharacterized protein n=1 Tax=Vibrio pectenicida TaxID=62763 RepID=A0A3R9EJD9_9VIBR|nr:hypothetical protein [Vibrio pectenicida]RSD31817.1 hypothetical protein EJA03_06855 [Vibrio pectenicida]
MRQLSVCLGALLILVSAHVNAAGWQTFYNPDGTMWTQAQYQGINGTAFPVVGQGLTATARINSTRDAVWFDIPISSNTNPSKVEITINDVAVTTWTGVMPKFDSSADGDVTKAVNTKTGMILSFNSNYKSHDGNYPIGADILEIYPWVLAGINQNVENTNGRLYKNEPAGGATTPPLIIKAGKNSIGFFDNRLVIGYANDSTNLTSFVIGNSIIANNGELMTFQATTSPYSAIIRLNPADFEIDNVWAIVY